MTSERHLFSAGISLVSNGAFFCVVSVRDFLTFKLFKLGDVFQAPFRCQGTGDVHLMDGLVGVVCFLLLCT